MFGAFERSVLPVYRDRRDAGRRLAAELVPLSLTRPLVLALPRGGVPVGFEIARTLQGDLDVLLVRKLGVPGHIELAAGAIAGETDADVLYNDDLLRQLGLTKAGLAASRQRETAELRRRDALYHRDRPTVPAQGRDVVVADDGIATGATVTAALRRVRREHPAHLVLAVPVATPEALERLRAEADTVVCPFSPRDFWAVGQAYNDFAQIEDREVLDLLRAAAAASGRTLRTPGSP
jgi:putative phosphoribosyl transferase